ncbi:MAG TPA: hypothetical protein VGZ47_12120, partial [Gemmataceae bacterium]|nr:hypothetical protein [Gemmataceae bacterium]
ALPKTVREHARRAYRHFQENPAHPGLHFHRLAAYPELWSVRVTRNYRAVGLVQGESITWFWIGTHKTFDREFPA